MNVNVTMVMSATVILVQILTNVRLIVILAVLTLPV